MSTANIIIVGALNISANPHPDDVYINALNNATKFRVNARGFDYAKITKPKQDARDNNLYIGRILVWTEISKLGRWLDTSNEQELSEEQKKSINIPDNAKPNYRAFDYVFNKSKHRLYFEHLTELGDKMGPTTARRIFENLLSRELLGPKSPAFAVSIVPRAGTVDFIFDIPQLRVLEIRVDRPNADTASPAAVKRVNDYLDRIHAQRVQQTFVKAADAVKLTPTEEIREFAEVAAENGFVKGTGRGGDGKRIEVTTEGSPKLVQIDVGQGTNLLNRIRSVLHLF